MWLNIFSWETRKSRFLRKSLTEDFVKEDKSREFNLLNSVIRLILTIRIQGRALGIQAIREKRKAKDSLCGGKEDDELSVERFKVNSKH